MSNNNIVINGEDVLMTFTKEGSSVLTIGTSGITGSVFSDINSNSAPNSLATVGYVNNIASGLAIKDPCKVVTSGTELQTDVTYGDTTVTIGDTDYPTNTLSGAISTLSIDSKSGTTDFSQGDRILVNSRSNHWENGFYFISSIDSSNYTLQRSYDADNAPSGNEVVKGALTYIEQGTTYGQHQFILSGTSSLPTWDETNGFDTSGTIKFIAFSNNSKDIQNSDSILRDGNKLHFSNVLESGTIFNIQDNAIQNGSDTVLMTNAGVIKKADQDHIETLDGLTSYGSSGNNTTCAGNGVISGTLGVTGATSLTGDLTGSNASFSGTLGVTGATGIDGDFDVANTKFTVASATGNTSIAGTLDANSTADIANTLTCSKATGTGLDVTANATIGGELSGSSGSFSGNLQCDKITVNELVSSSDRRLKENFHSIENAVEQLGSVNCYKFNWRETSSVSHGVIAQELEEIFPDLVNGRGDEYKKVNYIQFIPFLIESVKELKSEINTLKEKLN